MEKQKPLITVKEARKLLGTLSKNMTNEEVSQLIDDSEQMLRHIFRDYVVRKSRVV